MPTLKTIKSYPSRIAIFLIRCYQCSIGASIGYPCRYYPSCSRYAMLSIQQHGLIKGGFLTIKRVLRCHPWSAGGCDFPPD